MNNKRTQHLALFAVLIIGLAAVVWLNLPGRARVDKEAFTAAAEATREMEAAAPAEPTPAQPPPPPQPSAPAPFASPR